MTTPNLGIATIAWGTDRLTYAQLMAYADDWVRYGDYAIDGGRFEGDSLPDSFWPMYELVTGTTVEANRRHSFFSCSC